jgi:uncharacterized protein YjbI with pentapeptide repeats
MWERFKQWQAKIRINEWWLMGAIAPPVLLGMAGLLWLVPERRLYADSSDSFHNDRTILSHPNHDEFPVNNIGAIAMVAGGAVLLLNSRTADRKAKTPNLSDADFSNTDLSGADFKDADLNGADLNGANLSDANLKGADLGGADLNGANLSGADLSAANLNGANLISVNLSGANLSRADLRYANLSGADLRYANLSQADLRYADLSQADLNCTLLSDANFSEANLSGALLFFVNSREVLNLEPQQLKAKPSPFLCNVALPAYSQYPRLNPNRDCNRIPQLLSARYDIPLEEARGIVDEARQHRWD